MYFLTPKQILLFFFFLVYTTIISAQNPARELRGVWIATVKNIDFPSSTKLTAQEQQKEFSEILDFHQKNGINAVFMQIRPATDAFYASPYEPWSEWLNGKQGKAPSPFYDPLVYMIEQSHQRSMEFHAWFNPYRAVVDIDKDSLKTDEFHITRRKPEWFVRYGKNLYFNPGIPEARDYVIQVIMDVARRYEVDGIHFDDYFYPYRIANEDFKDSLAFEKYKGEFTNRDDWRRNNVDILIQRLSDSLQTVKPHIKFGVSPFGVWRNSDKDSLGSKSRAGQTCYDDLYADVRKWLQKGWIDYIAPQIYFSIGYPLADYQILAEWWRKNSFGRHLYIGHAAYKIKQNADSNWFQPDQIAKQISLNRQSPEIQGSIYFSAKSFKTNPLQINEQLQNHLYKTPALWPLMPWKKPMPFANLLNTKWLNNNRVVELTWELESLNNLGYVLIYRKLGKEIPPLTPENLLAIVPASQLKHLDTKAKKRKIYTYLIQTTDRLHNISPQERQFSLKLKGKRKLKFYSILK
jgi:uncharacterized lipoprotein YddW (UPF0748 family)